MPAGAKSKNDIRAIKFSKFCKSYSGPKNHAWRGNKAKYSALHMWIRKWKKRPTKCENPNCKYPRKTSRGILKKPTRFEWANISGKYKRNFSDWINLCTSCHQKFDRDGI